ncbi:hypothetical protein ACGFZR_15205 [Streptomyces sp. NPDC048241]|uniref:hypothetical protein n=1 Tax=Streptomyces sp. NPDC048241 TaxID=3365521 RepID=UPI0037236B79
MPNWPNKKIPDFTDDELVNTIKDNQDSHDPVTRQIVQGCWREWGRRNDLSIPE